MPSVLIEVAQIDHRGAIATLSESPEFLQLSLLALLVRDGPRCQRRIWTRCPRCRGDARHCWLRFTAQGCKKRFESLVVAGAEIGVLEEAKGTGNPTLLEHDGDDLFVFVEGS